MGDTTSGWETFYGLGWYDEHGRAHLTSWEGDRPVVRMLSIDCAPHRIPIWHERVPAGAKLIAIPEDPKVLDEMVRLRSGRVVIGWSYPEGITRHV